MDLQLQDKTALITGATAGIGMAIAQELAREGAGVTITGRTQNKIDQALGAIGNGAKGIVVDLSNAPGTEPLFAQLSRIDILVNNLGIYEPKEFVDITEEDWLRFFQVNVMSGVRLARLYLPGMLERNWGRLIFISSEAGIQTPPEMIHYGMTKSAQLAISRGLAEITKGTGVTVNTVMPGPTRSEGIVQFLRNMSTNPEATDAEVEREFFANHRSGSLLQRLIDAREIATMVAYLASPLSSATNGAALRAEGVCCILSHKVSKRLVDVQDKETCNADSSAHRRQRSRRALAHTTTQPAVRESMARGSTEWTGGGSSCSPQALAKPIRV